MVIDNEMAREIAEYIGDTIEEYRKKACMSTQYLIDELISFEESEKIKSFYSEKAESFMPMLESVEKYVRNTDDDPLAQFCEKQEITDEDRELIIKAYKLYDDSKSY